ncbi:SLC13 family permease [Candidatus Nitrosocosmicus hydrocola]|uniref:SLC13 family permease n=1 Tax=Candidatus Nitrosocosmicus hydrocola TaxID=1826872 RepID=UPI000A3DC146|nr:DASS family sodium-coupled anion symporter [Candidatus Nitrosocosmicus hydrocola]
MTQENNDKKNTKIARFGLIVGPLLFFILIFIPIEGLNLSAKVVLALTFWMGTWWITEAIPIYVTALLPLVLFPIFDIMSIGDLSNSYADSIIFLFLGGFILAKAIENANLHKRFALNMLRIFGTNPRYIMASFMIITAILSGWISNTATTMLMLPIALAIITQLKVNSSEQKRFGTYLLLSIAYSASVGGMATLIGTPPNAIFASVSESLLSVEISFGKWMLIGFPISLVTLGIAWIYLVKMGKISNRSIVEEKNTILKNLSELGKMNTDEKIVAGIFIGTAVAWITRGLLWKDFLPMVDDASIALIAALLFFILPSFYPKKPNEETSENRKEKSSSTFDTRLLSWKTAVTIPWGILLLIGGGLALAQGFSETGLDKYIANNLSFLEGMPYIFIILIMLVITVFAGEIISNTATAALLLPISASLAVTLSIDPLLLMVPITVATSIGFVLPVATPPNAIVFSSEYITTRKMARAGLPLDIIGILVVTMMTAILVPLVF